jgi:hypothetical protein
MPDPKGPTNGEHYARAGAETLVDIDDGGPKAFMLLLKVG